MDSATNPIDSLMLMGILLISEEIPSFGTPIFRHPELNQNFIQSSANGKHIDRFYPVRDMPHKSELFKYIGTNEPTRTGTPFLIGFSDINQDVRIYERKKLYRKIDNEFELYGEFPFLQWTMVTLFNSERWLKRLSAENMSLLVNEFSKSYPLKFKESIVKNLGLARPNLFHFSGHSFGNEAVSADHFLPSSPVVAITDFGYGPDARLSHSKEPNLFNWSNFVAARELSAIDSSNKGKNWEGITAHVKDFNLFYLRGRMKQSKTNT